MSDEPRDGAPEERPPDERAEPASRWDFDVFRLHVGHVIAFVAAIALLFVMAGPWYSTNDGVSARDIEHNVGQGLPGWGKIDPGAVDDARQESQKDERNAWKTSSVYDIVVLLALLATVALAIAAAGLRAAGRRYDPRRSPSAFAAGAAILAFALAVIQALARLGPDSPVVIQVGLPLGVIALGVIALGSGVAARDALAEGDPGADGRPVGDGESSGAAAAARRRREAASAGGGTPAGAG